MSKKNNVFNVDTGGGMFSNIVSDVVSRITLSVLTGLPPEHFRPTDLPEIEFTANILIAGKKLAVKGKVKFSKSEMSCHIEFPDSIPDQAIQQWLEDCQDKLTTKLMSTLNLP